MERHVENSQHISLMKAYIGIWNKLNSLHTIKIMEDKIEYSDGSKFDVSVSESRITAVYAKSQFTGQLIEDETYDHIKWNNGSVWIRNGFVRFEGKYRDPKSQQKYEINQDGTILCAKTGKKYRFKLLEYNRISYALTKESRYNGTLSEDMESIQWDNDSIWKNESNVELEHGREEEEDEAIKNAEPAEEKFEEIHTKTIEFEGEMEEIDFAQIEIKNFEHFVLVNDDELYGHNDDNMDGDKIDEWLLV